MHRHGLLAEHKEDRVGNLHKSLTTTLKSEKVQLFQPLQVGDGDLQEGVVSLHWVDVCLIHNSRTYCRKREENITFGGMEHTKHQHSLHQNQRKKKTEQH